MKHFVTVKNYFYCKISRQFNCFISLYRNLAILFDFIYYKAYTGGGQKYENTLRKPCNFD